MCLDPLQERSVEIATLQKQLGAASQGAQRAEQQLEATRDRLLSAQQEAESTKRQLAAAQVGAAAGLPGPPFPIAFLAPSQCSSLPQPTLANPVPLPPFFSPSHACPQHERDELRREAEATARGAMKALDRETQAVRDQLAAAEAAVLRSRDLESQVAALRKQLAASQEEAATLLVSAARGGGRAGQGRGARAGAEWAVHAIQPALQQRGHALMPPLPIPAIQPTAGAVPPSACSASSARRRRRRRRRGGACRSRAASWAARQTTWRG